jgi:hypothetical protein
MDFLGDFHAEDGENNPVDFVKEDREIFFDIGMKACYTTIAIYMRP